MFDTINTAGVLYLAGKALVRKTTQDVLESSKAPRYAGYVDVLASSVTNVALAAGALMIPAASGPVGLVLGAKDLWLHRAEIKGYAVAAHELARVKLINLRAWNNERIMRNAGVTGIGRLREVPKPGRLAAMKDWRDHSRAARVAIV